MSAAELSRALAADAENVCRYLLPNGRRVGHEWKAGSVDGETGDSLGVRLTGEKAGVWADFGGDESGDLIGLWKACRRVDVATACAEAEEWLGIAPRKPLPRAVAPEGEPSHVHARYGKPSATWAYRDAQGGILGYVCRFDPADGSRKQVLPQVWDAENGWSWRGFPDPRPLYGLKRLAERPELPVLVVEGEKCAEAATALLDGMVAVSWPGGCKALDKVDLAPLRGRVLTLWPDADDAGKAAMQQLAEKLGQPCRIVKPNGQADGWDIADAIAAGWDQATLIAWAREHIEEWFPEPPADDYDRFEPTVARGTSPEAIEYVSHFVPDSAMLEGECQVPTDIFAEPALPRLQPRWLPPAVSTFVFDQSQIIGSDPCILAVSVLVTCASVTHDRIRLQPKHHEHGWSESARLWGTFVGDPSVKKTPPLNRATAHLRKLEAEFSERSADEQRRYRIAQKVYEAAERKYIEAQAKNQPTAPLYDPPEKPPQRRLIIQDTTIEACADVLAENPQGILVLADELSGFFGSMDAYRSSRSGKDRSFWLEAYNGGPRRVDRVTRAPTPVPNLSACLLGGIQPGAMRAQARDMVDDGLLQRFIIVVAQGGENMGEDRRADSGVAQAYRSILDWLVQQDGDPDKPVLLSDEATAVRARVELKLSAFAKADNLPVRMRYQLGKWSGLFVRLCLTYHAIECANLAMPVQGLVAGDTAEAVEGFMFEYLFWHLQHFYEVVLGDSTGVNEMALKVARWILAKAPERFTNVTLSKAIGAWRSFSWVDRRSVLDLLSVTGWIEEEAKTAATANRSWRVNHRVHIDFASQAEAEKARRAKAREDVLGNAAAKREAENEQ